MLNVSNLRNFFSDEGGAVTVDWVVLTAAIVGLGVTAISKTAGGVSVVAGSISSSLTNQQVD